ncbi:MAG: ferrochelatase [Actinomycetota bacterium]
MSLGLLCMSYGTARGPEDLETYLTHIRRGRAPSPELVAEMRARYDAIGGRSPLIEITERQVRALEQRLGDLGVVAYHGMKHQNPYLEDVVERMASDGIERAVGLVLAPHYSRFSVGQYVERVEKAAADLGAPSFTFVESYATHPAFVEFVAGRVRDALAQTPGAEVVFSAHSLPASILEHEDPYPRELADTADAVAARLGITDYRIAWQSAGRTGEEWLGPDVRDVIRDLARDGTTAVVSCPVGFVSDHLEVLYDIDVEARETAREAGITLVRTASPNDDPAFIDALASVVRDHLEGKEH